MAPRAGEKGALTNQERADEIMKPMMRVSLASGLMAHYSVLALMHKEATGSMEASANIFALEAALIVLLEVPSGAIADLWGRKKTLQFGYCCSVVGILGLIYGGWTGCLVYILGWAISCSMCSGTESALAYDLLQEAGIPEEFERSSAKMGAVWPIGATLGCLLGAAMIQVGGAKACAFASLGALILTLVLLIPLREPPLAARDGDPASAPTFWEVVQQMRKSAITMWGIPSLRWQCLGTVLNDGCGEATHFMDAFYFTSGLGLPDKVLPLLGIGVYGCSSVGFSLSAVLTSPAGSSGSPWRGWNPRTVVYFAMASSLLMSLSSFSIAATGPGLGLAGQAAGAALFILPSISFGLKNPCLEYQMQKRIPSDQRATIGSIRNMWSQMGISILSFGLGRFIAISGLLPAFVSYALLGSLGILAFSKMQWATEDPKED